MGTLHITTVYTAELKRIYLALWATLETVEGNTERLIIMADNQIAIRVVQRLGHLSS